MFEWQVQCYENLSFSSSESHRSSQKDLNNILAKQSFLSKNCNFFTSSEKWKSKIQTKLLKNSSFKELHCIIKGKFSARPLRKRSLEKDSRENLRENDGGDRLDFDFTSNLFYKIIKTLKTLRVIKGEIMLCSS